MNAFHDVFHIVMFCLFGFVLCCFADGEGAMPTPAAEKVDTADTEMWNWIPAWREQADCGPNALYVLMNLEGHMVNLDEVKKLVPLDAVKGCSMEALIDAAAKLGFSLEARFVKPSDVHKLPRPFILHGITSQEKALGHFVVVADFDAKKRHFALIDPIRETHGWNPEASLLHGYSGYVLIPKYSMAWRWNLLAGVLLLCCAIGCVALLCRRYGSQRRV